MKKATSIVEPKEETHKPLKKKKEFFELRIPRISFHDTPINAFLVLSLVIFAFMLGMLTNKVLYLEKDLRTNTTGNNLTPSQIPYPTPPQIVNVDNGQLPLLGNKDAKVTIVEFSDFQCPFCQQFYAQDWKQLQADYIDTGKVTFAYRHYPLTTIHPLAQKAAEASECANEQGMFWDYFNKLFSEHDNWANLTLDTATTTWKDYAGQLGMNTDQFSSCLSSGKYAAHVTTDADAGTQAQVDGTPTFFINGYRVVGAVSYDQFKQVIDQELAKVK